jgi:large subunit ribosomal protein L25
MASAVTLQVETRSGFGKEKSAKLRQKNLIPGVIYGTDQAPEHVSIPYHEFDVLSKHVHGQTVLINIVIQNAAGEQRTEKVFLREVQRDPVTERMLHVDLLRVDLQKPVTVSVPVLGEGIPAGVKLGGLLETLHRSVAVRCLPESVPPYLKVDISEINISGSLRVSEVVWPENIEVVSPADTVLFTVLGKREEEEAPVAAAPVEGEETAEPEVIKRKKKEEEDEGSESK